MEKTITASVINLTKNKRELLDNDYNNYQWWMLFGIDRGLLSCFKAHKGFKQKVIKYKDYPLPLYSRFIKSWFRVRDTKITKNWIKIPNTKRKGIGLWLPLKFHQELPKNYTLKDSYLIKKNNKYYIHFCINIKEPKIYSPMNIVAIDLGLKNPITITNLKTKNTAYIGKELKEIRGKYFYLRKKLGKEKKVKQILKIKNKEKRKINTLLHTISKQVIENAYENKSAIVVGKLKNFNKNKGRIFNRKLSNFSYYKFTQFLEYKAKEKGVPLIKVSEYNTSKSCSACGSVGVRNKNLFKCRCGYSDNADRNASINIAKRGLSYALKLGVVASALKSLNEEINTRNMQSCMFA